MTLPDEVVSLIARLAPAHPCAAMIKNLHFWYEPVYAGGEDRLVVREILIFPGGAHPGRRWQFDYKQWDTILERRRVRDLALERAMRLKRNPFRRLPQELVELIKAMSTTWVPTPSALAIKQTELDIDYHGLGNHMIVYPCADNAQFISRDAPYARYYLLPHLVDDVMLAHYPLGRVLSRSDVRLRKYIQRLRKGSALNNPFRMLPSDVMVNIQAMTK